MSAWLIALIVVAFFVLRGVVFTYLLWRLGRLAELVVRYWKGEVEYEKAGERKREIVRLFRVAQLTEPSVSVMTPTVVGVMTQHGSAFENIFVRRGDVQAHVEQSFVEAAGYFKDEIRRSFIPLFWPSVIINLPADALVYVGVSPGAAVVRLAKVVTAMAGVVGAILVLWRAAT